MIVADFVVERELTPMFWEYASSLALVVAKRYYRTYDVEDLVSCAVVNLAEFAMTLEASDVVIRNIRSYFFTRIRNTMSNYVYSASKSVSTDQEILDCNELNLRPDFNISCDFKDNNEARLLSLKLWKKVDRM